MVDRHRFDFDLDRGIRSQVLSKLRRSPLLPLTKGVGPTESGIYAVYHKRKLVYVGKASKKMTKSGRTLRQRLNEHVTKVNKVRNLSLADMQCRYLTFASEWWVFAAEFALITHLTPAWNASGFGSKVPGIGRPGTDRISPWNALFPEKKKRAVSVKPKRRRGRA